MIYEKRGEIKAPNPIGILTLIPCLCDAKPLTTGLTDLLNVWMMHCTHHAQSRGAALFFERSEQFLITFSPSTSSSGKILSPLTVEISRLNKYFPAHHNIFA